MKKSIPILALVSIGVILLLTVLLSQDNLPQIKGLYDTTVIVEMYGGAS